MRRIRLMTLLGVSAAAAAAAVALPLVASAGPDGYEWPDLVSSAPPLVMEATPTAPSRKAVYLEENTITAGPEASPNKRLLLRFDGYIDNVGDGPLDLRGNPSAGAVVQWARPLGGDAPVPIPSLTQAPGNTDPTSAACTAAFPVTQSPTTGPCVTFDGTDSHNHWHVVDAARYTLEDQAGNLVAPGSKVGFCLADISRVPGATQEPTFYTTALSGFCRQGEPGATDMIEGISVGRRDVYFSGLAYQWVDVSNTRPGVYRLGNTVDPNNRIIEEDEANNGTAYTENVVIPGFVAKPVSASTILGQAVTVTLQADRFGNEHFGNPSESRRVFRIESLPARGTLRSGSTTLSVGSTTKDPDIIYVPAPGTSGVDSFEYIAYTQGSPYPFTHTRAAATVTVGNGQAAGIAISGAPSSLIAGTSAPLTATVTNAAPGVTWAVNGVTGGNATVGRVTAAGVYTAPATVPPGGSVTVRATSIAVPALSAQVTIRVTAPPPATPAPTPTVAAPPPSAGKKRILLGKPSIARFGRRVVVRVVPGRTGRLVVTVYRGPATRKATPIGRCVVRRAVPGRSVVCNVRLKPRTPRITVRAVAVLATTKKPTLRATAIRKRL